MPKLSQKGKAMPASPIRKLVPYAEKAAKEGKKIYYLNIGQPDIPTPSNAIETLKNTDIHVLAYSHSAGNESYRKKLTGYYNDIGIDVSYEDILITTGGSEAILFGLFSTMDAGDELIIPEPFYANYLGFATAGDIKIKPITSTIEDQFSLPPVKEFEKLINDKTKGIMICNPNNPTGYLYSREELNVLKDLALKYDLYLYADEVYREFCYDGQEHFSLMQLKGLEEHVILFDSVSKRYSECGARIGALVSKNKKVIDTALKFAQARLSPPTLAQIVAEASLDVDKSYFKKVIKEYTNRRNYLIERLNNIEGVYAPNPGGAFYAVARLPIEDSDHFCQWMLESFEYKGETIMMAPASGFYHTEGLGKNEVRIAYVLKQEDLKKALDCLEEGLKAYNKKS